MPDNDLRELRNYCNRCYNKELRSLVILYWGSLFQVLGKKTTTKKPETGFMRENYKSLRALRELRNYRNRCCDRATFSRALG